jgi:hypothetical protein
MFRRRRLEASFKDMLTAGKCSLVRGQSSQVRHHEPVSWAEAWMADHYRGKNHTYMEKGIFTVQSDANLLQLAWSYRVVSGALASPRTQLFGMASLETAKIPFTEQREIGVQATRGRRVRRLWLSERQANANLLGLLRAAFD